MAWPGKINPAGKLNCTKLEKARYSLLGHRVLHLNKLGQNIRVGSRRKVGSNCYIRWWPTMHKIFTSDSSNHLCSSSALLLNLATSESFPHPFHPLNWAHWCLQQWSPDKKKSWQLDNLRWPTSTHLILDIFLLLWHLILPRSTFQFIQWSYPHPPLYKKYIWS